MYRVLIADDDLVSRKLLELLLKKAGCEVLVCADGREASEVAAREHFDQIIMDIQMPVMGGLEAAGVIKTTAINKDTPLMALSGVESKEEKMRCMAAGFDDFLNKPVNPEQLGKKINRRIATNDSIQNALAGNDISSLFADDKTYQKCIAQFADELPKSIAQMSDVFSKNDIDELKRLAHSLKGTGSMAGFPVFSHLARQLEGQIASADTPAIEQTLARLKTLSASLKV